MVTTGQIVNFEEINMNHMKGIHYVTDDKNNKVAVQIDLKQYGELWEDIQDILIAESRKNEETVSWEKVKEDLQKAGKL